RAERRGRQSSSHDSLTGACYKITSALPFKEDSMRPLAKLATAALLVLGALPAVAADEAGVPAVVATIGPLHSLASAVMQGVGAPSLLVPGGASPHAYSLRPSEAGVLQEADLIVWVGPRLERFLEEGLESLAKGTRQVEV